MKKTLVLVAYVEEKAGRAAAPAREFFISDRFKKTARLAEMLGEKWYILSTKHGLLPADKVIEPYCKTFKDMDEAERKYWAERVFRDIEGMVSPGDTIICLADNSYLEYLLGPLATLGVEIQTPLAGLRDEEQLAWIDKRLRDISGLD